MRSLLLAAMLAGTASPVLAAPCGGDFDTFIAAFSREAAAQRISQRTLASAFEGLTLDPQVIALDRRQGVFRQSFEQFALPRIEQRFGVPGPILIAIWGLETDFGVGIGPQPVIRAVATLAHDCRRSEMFQDELMAALTIVERGDLNVAEMRGAWAGELGQTQFLPSSYVKFAVDFDGNGRRDLIHSVPDVLASTANYLRGYGWERGQPWTEGTPNFSVLKA